MNKKKRWTIEQLLSGALALLGFAGCENVWNEPDLYGTPSVDFRVLGTVTDQTGTPLKGIQVVVGDQDIINGYESPSQWNKPDTTYTDSKGEFSSSKIEAITYQNMMVNIQDIDGEANGGEFEGQKLAVKNLEKKQVKEGDSWYDGEFEFSTKVRLKKVGK